jgi:glycosyltransferase involved in cell wall biosynthesis
MPETITVVIGVRNRVDYKLANTLASLQGQNADGLDVLVVVVDYDNEPVIAAEIKRLCLRHQAEYLRIDDHPDWSKPHCYNIAIKRARTKYLMSCDADILFSPDYLSTAIAALNRQPLSVIYSQMRDLPQSAQETLDGWSETADPAVACRLFQNSTPRSAGDSNEGINLTFTYYYQLIRGYDEFYTHWGTEDVDLQKRFRLLGLAICSIKNNTFYLHQWHPKYASLDPQEVQLAHVRNVDYYRRTNSIYRNDDNWGEPRSRLCEEGSARRGSSCFCESIRSGH